MKFLNPYEVTYEPNGNVVKHWSDPRPIGRLAGKTLYTTANKIPDFFTATRPTADDHWALGERTIGETTYTRTWTHSAFQ